MARNRKQMAEINVVPMIDVMLVLLVIFMVTAPFINPSQVEGKTSQTPQKPLEIIIKESGEYLLRDRASGGSERVVAKSALPDEIAAFHRAQPDQPVVIAADKNIRYEEVMHTMTLLQQAQITRIGLLARPAP